MLPILVAGKWLDWWGGVTWGYRSIVDAAPFLALLTIPIVDRIVASRPLRVVCGSRAEIVNTDMRSPVASANFCSSTFHSRLRLLFEPPPSAIDRYPNSLVALQSLTEDAA